MLDAIHPLKEYLVMPKLLRHQDGEVSLRVAICKSEITRITTPNAPYRGDVLKDIFQLIIIIFRELDDIASPLFGERVTILETMAKIESCVLMLDIGCADLILEMFHIFLFVVSGDHPENVLTSMQVIMNCTLDE